MKYNGIKWLILQLWEYYGQRRCIRTYVGHFEAVVDLCFNNDGTKFLSCSFDKYIKLWNTETGECLSRFSTGKVPRCVRFNPAPDKQHMFVAGCKDKKIVQWDINTGEVVQEYDRHLGAVNTVTFTEEGNRFVSTSDDQSIRVWEWEIPVDFKYIAEPTQHSMPKTAIHPNGKWICFQSMDNFIYVFSASGRYRQHKKKRFSGHLTAGYACDVNFSPDGNYVISGDYEGRLVIWDWKSGKLYSKMDCHKQVTIGCIWHPHEPSQVVTCSWDGTIKLWD
ncbi:pre-mRNA-processing factor 17-like [Zophobas morio]|uniref:pre-mRNA-processing factor 17-like n=1 Tax=Zophobas morio TaxID=2755281 RepID=UPI003083D0FF